MESEEKVFERYYPDFDKLTNYGFIKTGKVYSFGKNFKNNTFKAIIEISQKGDISGKVIELESDEEYLPLRIKNSQGTFVGEIRDEYSKILKNIRENCFIKQYFIYPQSNRVTNLITEKYGDFPEFLWEQFQGSGIFRNPDSNKWYAAILDVDRGKLQRGKCRGRGKCGKKGKIEVINLKLNPDKIQELLEQPNFYPAYHMNKKYWISIILDDTVSDKKIMELVEESHKLIAGK